MKKEWIKWTAGMALGLSLITASCGDKKEESDASSPPVGLAPSSLPEISGPDGTLAPSGGSQQSPSGTKKEQNTGGERKAPRK